MICSRLRPYASQKPVNPPKSRLVSPLAFGGEKHSRAWRRFDGLRARPRVVW